MAMNKETKKYQMFTVDTSLLFVKTIKKKFFQEIDCHLKLLKTLLIHYFLGIDSCHFKLFLLIYKITCQTT